jgi:hypothetical protein
VSTDLESHQVWRVIVFKKALADGIEEPESFFLCANHQNVGREDVHALAVADPRVVKAGGAQDTFQTATAFFCLQ